MNLSARPAMSTVQGRASAVAESAAWRTDRFVLRVLMGECQKIRVRSARLHPLHVDRFAR